MSDTKLSRNIDLLICLSNMSFNMNSVKEDSCAVSYLPNLEAEKQYGSRPQINSTFYCVSWYRQGDQKHHFLQETQQAFQASHDPLVEIKLVYLSFVGVYFFCPILFLFFFAKMVQN